MTQPYNHDSTPIASTSQKDNLGIFFIGVIAFIGLGYLLFNPNIYLQSDNYSTEDDAQILVSPATLNAEKITYDLLETRTPSMDTQIATDSKH